VDWIHLADYMGKWWGCCERSNETSDLIKGEVFLV